MMLVVLSAAFGFVGTLAWLCGYQYEAVAVTLAIFGYAGLRCHFLCLP